MDDDPRDDPRERYGNEEDRWSREFRRAYAEEDLPRRMQNDRPYDRPGYEPEFGRPGGRENVDLDRGQYSGPNRRYTQRTRSDLYGYDWEQTPGRRGGYGQQDDRWQGGYYGQGSRFSGRPFEPEGHGGREPRHESGRGSQSSQGGRTEHYGQPSYGRAASPYDEGEVSPWYGGDTGMGDPGSSLYGSEQYGSSPTSQYGSQVDAQRRQQYGDRNRFGPSGRPMPGRFSGRGPRGYQRSDERIREDVCELLTHHGEIDASNMEIDVRQATVILRGMADSGRTRRLAEELIEDIPGVRDVQNELRVPRRTGYDASDSQAMGDGGTFAANRSGIRESGGPSQQANRWHIHETMDVVGSDGENVGTVKAVHGTDFHVDRPKGQDLFIPFSAVQTVDGERVMLKVRAGEVDDQGWPARSLAGSNESPAAR